MPKDSSLIHNRGNPADSDPVGNGHKTRWRQTSMHLSWAGTLVGSS
jgi:hypothetical protein